MGRQTKIEWTDHTWNCWRGCRKVSAGCKNCYMFRGQKRWGNDPTEVVRSAYKTFSAPLKWFDKKALVFTCSWSDYFIEEADEWRDDAWQIMRDTPNLTYQILTKRIDNVPSRLPDDWPLENVWLGTSVENQEAADDRIPKLIKIPCKIKFLSMEPLLGPVDLGCTCWLSLNTGSSYECEKCGKPRWLNYGINWIVLGGESGPGARPMDIDDAVSVRDQCSKTEIPFFFKQVGGFNKIDGAWGGKKLQGKEHQELPGEYNTIEEVKIVETREDSDRA